MNETMSSVVVYDAQTGFGYFFLTLGFFNLLNGLCSFIPVPEAVLIYQDDFRTFRWRNLIISWCHAFIVGIWSLICLLLYFDEMWKDMVMFNNGPTYKLCCFTAGYFVYDMIDIVRNRRVLQKWDILIHHFAIILSAGYVIAYVQCIAYQVVGMLAEMNTTFLHARQLMYFAKVPRTNWLVRTNIAANLFTFLLFRFVPMTILFWGVTIDGHRVPFWYVSYYTACLVVLFGMNLILLYRLIRSDFFRGTKKIYPTSSSTPRPWKG